MGDVIRLAGKRHTRELYHDDVDVDIMYGGGMIMLQVGDECLWMTTEQALTLSKSLANAVECSQREAENG